MKKYLGLFLIFLIACSTSEEEKKIQKIENDLKNLPKLAPIEVPEGSAGTYVGMLPCDDCESRRVKLKLDSAGTATVEEILVAAKTDTLRNSATYLDSAGKVVVRFDDGKRFLAFEKHRGTSLYFLTLDGKVYRDESDEPYQLLRILNAR